ncbi:bifunctional (p)ppGpp synthetase/guanosine-3',5'-bis(diphosphate) 3'-pyrophosphohydrolase [Elizabethkingia sp. JS20170427COW]|uniref:RelA/SpoT family protein n=1 Tax=Elizabethkingia sp. JS20170427COW TaxID=2583851 RepID=UPI001110EF32|nr:RelA/SpoT family protein [Elizabethkingia sp. JS20170427COW]QCX52250.1 bifunctional (p)ppGpp synthetase/guanosine-3',5'-bis(diphosphate) 3'-pyrophosphohydrolase [Elizabethkingia sp. JS20170427COW]
MAYDLEQENKEILARYKDLISNTYRTLDEDKNKLIRKAFDIALDAHKDQRRKTGEPYIYHPIEVAKIVANEIGLGATSIAAALLHDVIEDSEYTYEDLNRIFGKEIADIVQGLTKISIMNNQNISVQSENYRKLLMTLAEDFRVILIKIADRLHNMRTLDSMRPDKQKKIASETVYIYAPLAHRLGLYNIKSELEDLSLKYNNPEVYQDISDKLNLAKESREKYIEEFKQEISSRLKEEGLHFTIKGRAKAISSIYRKILKQNVTFEEVYDNYAIRIIYKSDLKNEKFLAWKIYSIITDVYHNNPTRMRDWISQPRSTGYESLHLTVLGPDNKWIEVQIRSERMDEVAEKGVAAHYKYKEGYDKKSNDERNFEQWVIQIREVLENNQLLSTNELLDNIKLNLYSKEVFIFTPQGEIKLLPQGATALDFAFSVHTDLGMKCLGAKVNGKLVPISHVLKSGDQVDILTSNNQRPKADWLEFVVTSKARSKIKNALNADKNLLVNEGKEILQRKMRHAKLSYTDDEINKLQKYFNFKTSQDLFLNFQNGNLDTSDLKKYVDSKSVISNLLQKFRRAPKTEFIPQEPVSDLNMIVFGKDEQKMDYSFAKCCTVVPGDKIFGFITINDGIKVHNDNCPNAINLRANYDYRVMTAKWVNSEQFSNRVKISIEGLDRIGMINDISNIISSNMSLDMKSFSIESNNGIFIGNITLEIQSKNQVDETLNQLKKIKGVTKVHRT